MVSAELRRAVGDLDGPFGVIDRDAFDRNIAALRARAAVSYTHLTLPTILLV